MKNILLTGALLVSSVAFAGTNHYHPKKILDCSASPCTAAQIEAIVPKALGHLVKEKQCEKSWEAAKVTSVAQKAFKKGPEWVVTLEDEKTKQKRYVFITMDGFVNGTNLTGE